MGIICMVILFVHILKKMDIYLDKVFFNDTVSGDNRPKRRSGIGDKDDYYVNFFVIGPVDTESRKVTGKFFSVLICNRITLLSYHVVNLFLERLHYPGRDIGRGALMLTVRPLKIAGIDVSKKFKKYTPPIE